MRDSQASGAASVQRVLDPVKTPRPVRASDRVSATRMAAVLLRRTPVAQTDHLSLTLGGVPGSEADPSLLTTVPKRLLARAVDRNQFKRVAREFWRGRPDHWGANWALIRLRRRPRAFSEWSRGERLRQWRTELAALIERSSRRRSTPAGHASEGAQR